MKAFLTGLGVGAGLGILFAPDSGERTRRRVWEKVGLWTHAPSRQLDRVKNAVVSQADQLSHRASAAPEEQNGRGAPKRPQARSTADSDLINTLSRDDLMTVNGIGPVLAERIISGRPYSSIRDLVDRRIIAQSTLDELERQFSSGLEESA
jgi:DNA uptake protein ComE-like DNA-binding protein